MCRKGLLILFARYCTHYFNPAGGKEPSQVIRKLTPEDRKRIIERYQEWTDVQGHDCTAFAYRPILEQLDASVFNAYDNDEVHIVDDSRVATGEIYTVDADSIIEGKLQVLNALFGPVSQQFVSGLDFPWNGRRKASSKKECN